MGCSTSKEDIELRKGLDVYRRYEFICLLGKGSTSQVHEAQDKKTGKECAIKCIVTKEAEALGRQHLGSMVQQLWGILEHPNVCKLLSIYQDEQLQYFVMELVEGKSFFHRLEEQIVLMEADAGRIGFQMFSAVAYIHGKDVCHRDLKPECWLMSDHTPQAHVKLIDFGLAEKCRDDTLTEPCGTLHYLAPEVLRGRYGKAADVWTIGVVMFLSLYADYPFDGDSCTCVMQSILGAEPDWSDSCYALSTESRDLLRLVLNKDRTKRPMAAEASQHAWFATRSRYSVAPAEIRSKNRVSCARGPRRSELVNQKMIRRLSTMEEPVASVTPLCQWDSQASGPLMASPMTRPKGNLEPKMPLLPCVPVPSTE